MRQEAVHSFALAMQRVEAIRQQVQNSNITLVGSSILIKFDFANPQNTHAVLLDPDHPILHPTHGLQNVPQQILQNNQEIFDRYRGYYKEGMNGLMLRLAEIQVGIMN